VQIERGVGQDLAANTCQADKTLPGRMRKHCPFEFCRGAIGDEIN